MYLSQKTESEHAEQRSKEIRMKVTVLPKLQETELPINDCRSPFFSNAYAMMQHTIHIIQMQLDQFNFTPTDYALVSTAMSVQYIASFKKLSYCSAAIQMQMHQFNFTPTDYSLVSAAMSVQYIANFKMLSYCSAA